ncbi:hypothetical protein JG687_00015580 [Phytophthora cactorum]|uniref:DDE-1 domain-containing protein n=1 Tax=Phytophthora cactorum TaxID=29920 RepID=A0A329RX72_9STRA|nr:hypothetical protein Pcac1_g25656 [Phytophthora cactorum]KAG2834168.1 hypothetical protein PC112_g6208 [Phytophthora cactorum]KAG2836566.1 hypothetical protein PC111_g4967 [Phytophthora cactorum]KAG2862465.1 hypothetical protein PC113_g6283 [Phytophthora cactorum]KAG2911270.1 hypothetical protein PC115_g12605 [Phytophthora cactorum]
MELSVVAKLYNVDVRQAVLWSIESWNDLSSTTPVSCWKKTGLLDYYTCEYAEPDEDDGITEELTAMLSRLHASNPMSVDELLNPPEENVLMEDPTDEDFCRVFTNSEYEARSELTSVDATGEDGNA